MHGPVLARKKIFRQLFEPISSTYTYPVGCEENGQAVLVDPVLPTWQRDLEELKRLGLKLFYTPDTHIHADHISAAATLKREIGSLIAHPELDGLDCVDLSVQEKACNPRLGGDTWIGL